jgi:hypothetical protein
MWPIPRCCSTQWKASATALNIFGADQIPKGSIGSTYVVFPLYRLQRAVLGVDWYQTVSGLNVHFRQKGPFSQAHGDLRYLIRRSVCK